MGEVREEYRRRARRALMKPPAGGPDVDLAPYIAGLGASEDSTTLDLSRPDVRRTLLNVGIDTSEAGRSGSYYQVDQVVLRYYSRIPGLKLMSLEEALEEHWDEISEYFWKAVPVDKDKFTAVAELYGRGGYVIFVEPGVKVEQPIQTCLLMRKDLVLQAPHNIVIVGDEAELHVITGCTIMKDVAGLHAGVSEMYVGRGAKLTFTMIHGWSVHQHVRPRTGVVVEEGGEYVSHYVVLAPSKTLQTEPVVVLKRDARAYVSSVAVGQGSSVLDVGALIRLVGEGSSAEVVSRSLGRDSSTIIARARLQGEAKGCRGHVECTGLLLSDEARIEAVPELVATVSDVELTHEASIGRIAEEEIIYLMARGFSRDEARSLIVRGFLSVRVKGLPRQLEKLVEQTVSMIAKGL